jgi:hypothetical protein
MFAPPASESPPGLVNPSMVLSLCDLSVGGLRSV